MNRIRKWTSQCLQMYWNNLILMLYRLLLNQNGVKTLKRDKYFYLTTLNGSATNIITAVDAGTWVDWYIKMHENVEIAFMCGIYNMVVYKFDLDVSRRTDRWRKSRLDRNRSIPSIHFPKHQVFHFAPVLHFAPTSLLLSIFPKLILSMTSNYV